MHDAYQRSLLSVFTEKTSDNTLILTEWSLAIEAFERDFLDNNEKVMQLRLVNEKLNEEIYGLKIEKIKNGEKMTNLKNYEKGEKAKLGKKRKLTENNTENNSDHHSLENDTNNDSGTKSADKSDASLKLEIPDIGPPNPLLISISKAENYTGNESETTTASEQNSADSNSRVPEKISNSDAELNENQLELKRLFLQFTEKVAEEENPNTLLPSINNSTSTSPTSLASPDNEKNSLIVMPTPTNLHKTSTIARMTQHLENHNRADNSTSNNLTNNMTTNIATLPQNLINLAYLQQNFNHQNLTPLNMTRIPQIMKPEQYASLQQQILVQQALTQTHNSSLQQKHINVTHDLRLQQRKRTRIPPSKQELQISEALLHHNRLGEKSQCSICGKFVMQLPAHMQCHSNERKYCCPKCPSKFKRMQTLKQHLPIHLDKPQFRCDICGNTFKQAPNFYGCYENWFKLKPIKKISTLPQRLPEKNRLPSSINEEHEKTFQSILK